MRVKAVIPAAGLGSRFLPATKAQPKEMLAIVDKPVIQYIVEEALDAGVDEVIIVSSRDKASIEEQFTPNAQLEAHLRKVGKDSYADAVRHAGELPVTFTYQDEPLGLGHAVYCAAAKTEGEPVMVMLGDVLVPDQTVCNRMRTVSDEHGGASVIAVVPVPDEEVSRFGIVGGDNLGGGIWKVDQMVEKPSLEQAPSNLAIFGRYLLTPTVMGLLAQTKPGAGGEIQLTDALVALLAQEDVYALVIDPNEGFDTGTVATWIEANVAMAMRNPKIASHLKKTIGGLFA
jgi:UTP--glucose-1-phosphate uridylyltransferase